MDLSEKINEYVDQMDGLYKTKRTYKDDIAEFIMFLCEHNKTIETQNVFKDYETYLKDIKKRTENTIRRKKTVISRFYLFCYPKDDFNHFHDCIIYYDRKNKFNNQRLFTVENSHKQNSFKIKEVESMEYDIQVRRRDNQGNIVMKTVLKGYSREHAKSIIKRAIEVDRLNIVHTSEIEDIIKELANEHVNIKQVIKNG